MKLTPEELYERQTGKNAKYLDLRGCPCDFYDDKFIEWLKAGREEMINKFINNMECATCKYEDYISMCYCCHNHNKHSDSLFIEKQSGQTIDEIMGEQS